MAIALLGAWGTGATHTAEAGSNRILILHYTLEDGTDTEPTAIEYGGQGMTLAVTTQVGTTTINTTQIWYLLEAGIAAAIGGAFVVTAWSVGVEIEVLLDHAFFSGAKQSAQPLDFDTGGATSGTSASTPAVTTENGGLITASLNVNTNGLAFTWTAPTTEITEQNNVGAGFTMGGAYQLTDGSNVTPSVSWTGSNRNTLCAASFSPAAGDSPWVPPPMMPDAVPWQFPPGNVSY
mgnify:CR=1 FL=1